PRQHCFHELFEAQVHRAADAPAVVFENEQLTYGQLNVRANQLAHYLHMHGVGPETRVGIFLERSLDLVVAVLAVLKAGGAYVPLDPPYPRQRLAFMLEDVGASVLLVHSCLRQQLPVRAAQVICLDTARDTIAEQPQENPRTKL